ncbi:hypothetical protein HK102_001633 [Quaeritorhiza haematococci]|nr:hypothetical protein HK102_001633 [Quaeritorhiza haematococci]
MLIACTTELIQQQYSTAYQNAIDAHNERLFLRSKLRKLQSQSQSFMMLDEMKIKNMTLKHRIGAVERQNETLRKTLREEEIHLILEISQKFDEESEKPGRWSFVIEWLQENKDIEWVQHLKQVVEANLKYFKDIVDGSDKSKDQGADSRKKVQDRNGVRQPIWDISFNPQGTHLIAAAGTEVLVYDVAEGELVQTLKSHKDSVYCVDYAADGQRFASGGADKQVIIWSSKLEGLLKYSHNDPIQALAHNPVTGQVVSCTSNDFGLWSAEQKTVAKHKVSSRICSVAWTNDGQYFALGLFSGTVSIRNKVGEEKTVIERGSSPVWSLCWSPSPENDVDVLAVTDWNQKLSFFQLNGRQVGKDRNLGFDPCSVSYFSSGEYVVIGGSDRKVTLWTAEGIRIGPICDREHWVWCCKVKPRHNYVVVGCQDGTIACYQIVFNTVHGLYHDRYAFRENLTDVVIQHLATDQRARIKCRDYVKKIAVYRDRLAVQLPDRVIIYELFHDDATDMHYRIKEKLQKRLECNLLVVTSQHIILCLERKLQMINFNGEKEREWGLEALIRYIKVIGGPKGREGLLVGLKNGQILQIFIDNHFPIPIIKQNAPVRCLDLSSSRTKLAVVDEQSTCSVYDLRTKELLYQEPNANSVAWNMDMEDMLCYSGNGILNIKAGGFPPQQQKQQGFVVGFKGSRIFCLHVYSMTTVDVPFTASLNRYLEKKDFAGAYPIACLGVTDADWRRLAMEALENMEFEIARKAFVHIRDLRYVDLIRTVEKILSENKNDRDLCLAEIYAFNGRFHEAARLYKKSGHVQKAIEMYTELNMWEYATQLAQETNLNTADILKRKAQMQQDRNDLLAAATTYVDVGDFMQAIDILGPNGWLDKLIEVARKLNRSETKALSRCVYFFRKHGHHDYAAECLVKMGDMQHLLRLHIELQHWDDAFKLADVHPEFASEIYLPYANWLAMNDRFVEAQLNFKKAGRFDEAFRVLEQLSQNAILEKRFEDGSFYFWMLAMQHLDTIPDATTADMLTQAQRHALQNFYKYCDLAEVYYAYHHVHRYMDEPFTSHLPESLFNMARFVQNYINNKPTPPGVSKAYVLFALARLSRSLGAFRLARSAYEKLQMLRLPEEWEDQVDLCALTIRTKPSVDREDLSPLCLGCRMVNPLQNPKGNRCINCLEPFVNSFYSFDCLPLVQFTLEPGISDEEAARLIATSPPLQDDGESAAIRAGPSGESAAKKKLLKHKNDSGAVLEDGAGEDSDADSNRSGGLAGADLGVSSVDDPFNRQLLTLGQSTGGSSGYASGEVPGTKGIGAADEMYQPVKVGRKHLLAMEKTSVFIRRWGKKCVPNKYYKLMVHDCPVSLCPNCQHFFMEDEWCYQVLQKKGCPFCRTPQELE